MAFNFSENQNYQSSSKPKLKGGEIHKVLFKGAKYVELEGKQDKNKGKTYKTLQFQFENEGGYFNHPVFDPGSDSDVRRKMDYDGREIETPSPTEEIQILVGQVLSVVNPEGLKKLVGKDIVGFEKLARVVEQLAAPGIDTEVELKLMYAKDKSPRLPIFASLNRQGEVYPSSNFIAKEGLFFTDKEKTNISKIESAVPTDVKKVLGSSQPVAPKVDKSDLDLDLL